MDFPISPRWPCLLSLLVGGSCSDDWYGVGDFCYFVSAVKVTWQEAEEECESLGGKLASIHSRQENYSLKSKISFYC